MGKLIKYEFRKTRMTRIILLFLAAVSEILFLSGLFLDWDRGTLWGISLLLTTSMFGIIYIGIESIITLSRDLNTRQSYLLFLTPRNSYQILGAKALENMISMIAAGIFFALLLIADASIARMHLNELDTFLYNLDLILNSTFDNLPSLEDILFSAFNFLLEWFMTITIGYLAVVLSATVLAGKRMSGFLSFLLFLLISWAVSFILELTISWEDIATAYLFQTALILLFSAGAYALSGWILERKMSL